MNSRLSKTLATKEQKIEECKQKQEEIKKQANAIRDKIISFEQKKITKVIQKLRQKDTPLNLIVGSIIHASKLTESTSEYSELTKLGEDFFTPEARNQIESKLVAPLARLDQQNMRLSGEIRRISRRLPDGQTSPRKIRTRFLIQIGKLLELSGMLTTNNLETHFTKKN